MCTCQKQDISLVSPIVESHRGQPGALIAVLQELQSACGWLSRELLAETARCMEIPASRIWGVVTFYSQFRLEPKGKHTVKVCQGTACHVAGASTVLGELCSSLDVKPGGTTDDGLFTVESVACLGCCSLAVAVTVDETTHSRVDARRIKEIVEQKRKEVEAS